ncbi:MAG: glycoside hydrolase family 9 protein [bacterium]
MKFTKNIYATMLLSLLMVSCELAAKTEIFIRVNQLGFLPGDIKSAVILSANELEGRKYSLVNSNGNAFVYENVVGSNLGQFGKFPYSYRIDFSDFKIVGKYYISIESKNSYSFEISNQVYNGLIESLMSFFKVQRCGYTEPLLHNVCHKADATSLIEDGVAINQQVDVTGGWHDAGDYVKFLNTTAVATYTLLFAFDFNNEKFSFDNNQNNVPDILEEAKIGLDWMLRSYIDEKKLITQVQDSRDQDVGWRLPENDPLGFDRPGYVGIGKNLIGIYSATMALAARIWKNTIHYDEFANKCLNAAVILYSHKDEVPDIDSSGTGKYIDNKFQGKLALGAIELFNTTGKVNYLNDAKRYADDAGPDYWWSWGDINAFSHYRLARYDLKYADYIKNSLEAFNQTKDKNLFGGGASYTWGTNNTFLGIALQNILWKKLTKDESFKELETFQRDFVLGRNQWGVCFISKVGNNYTKNFHHQVGYFNQNNLPGAVSAGPISKKAYNDYKIQFDRADKFIDFQTEDAVYRDDKNDYLSNEPSIVLNATAVFVFGNLAK